jgi:cell division septation protein DedD
VFLFMAATVVLVFTFLCGVQIGRNVGGDRGVVADSSDVTGVGRPRRRRPPTPTEAARRAGPPAAEPPAPAQDDELSYAKRLQQAEPAATESCPRRCSSRSSPRKRRPPRRRHRRKPHRRPTPAAVRAAWIVQLSANKDRGVAANTARDLVTKGYPAFVLDPSPAHRPSTACRSAGIPDRDKADQAARRLEKDEHFKPYVRSR